jgi:hypothetical protein
MLSIAYLCGHDSILSYDAARRMNIAREPDLIKTYTGSCHCGAVRFEADLDLSQGTGKCNCSICTKTRNWGVSIKPDAFRLISGEDAQSDYQFGTLSSHHLFCRHCGVRTFGKGYVEQMGGAYVSISLASLDGVDPAELIDAPVNYCDGRNNAWWNRPAETRHL